MSPAIFRKALLFLAVLGLVVRIGYFVEHAHAPTFAVPSLDERYYDRVAKMLLSGEDLRQLHGFRPLLYPMFLACWYRLGGLWGADLAILVQHLLGIGTGIFVAVLGARVFRNRLAGIFSGVLYLLAPVPLYFEGELLIESSYIFLSCAGLLVAALATGRSGRRGALLWAGSGALMMLAAQARANIVAFMAFYPAFGCWLFWQRRRQQAWMPLAGLVGGMAMAAIWGLVNLRQSPHYNLLPNAGGVNFYLGNRKGADGMFVGRDLVRALSNLSKSGETADGNSKPGGGRIVRGEQYDDAVEVWARAEYETAMRAQGRQPSDDPMAVSRFWTARTLDEIRSDPGGWVRLLARKCWLMLWNVEVPNNKDFAFLQQEFTWLKVLPVRWVVLLMLAPVGVWLALKRGARDDLLVVLSYAAIYSTANVAFFICDRYRYPVWPAMAVLAGGGVQLCVENFRDRRYRQLLAIGAVAGFVAMISIPNWLHLKLPNFAHDYQFRSMALYAKGRFPEALEDIDQSIKLDPLDASSLQQKGNVLFALNRPEEARRAYEETLKLVPGDSAVWNNLGVTLDSMGQTEAALDAFRRSTDSGIPDHKAFIGMAFIQIRQGKLEEASATLDKLAALEQAPDAATIALRSVIERRRGNVQRADQLEQQARQRDAQTAEWAIEQVGQTKRP